MSQGKAHSYTVSFGALEISVSSSAAVSQPRQAVASKCSSRDEALHKQLVRSQRKDSEKRAIRDEAYWDRQHEVISTPAAPVRAPPRYPSHDHMEKKQDGYTHLPKFVQSIVETDEQRSSRDDSINVSTDSGAESSLRSFFNICAAEADVLCWTCTKSLSQRVRQESPRFLPFRFHPCTGYYMVRGFFCSWECVRMHAISLGGNLHVVSLLAQMLRKLYTTQICIRPICTRLQLEVFGGNITMKEFQSSLHKCNFQPVAHLLQWHPEMGNCVRILSD